MFFKRKDRDIPIPAEQLTRKTFERCRTFARGEMVSSYMTHNGGPEITFPAIDKYLPMTAREGDWIVRENGYIWVYSPEAFKKLFEYEPPKTM